MSYGISIQGFVEDEEYEQLEIDLKNNNYIPWVERYPKYIYSLFALYLELRETTTIEDIKYFQDHGTNLNEPKKIHII